MRAGYLHSGEGEGEGQVRASEGNALGRSGGKDDAPPRRPALLGAQGPMPPTQEDTHVAAASDRRVTPPRDVAARFLYRLVCRDGLPRPGARRGEGDDC